MCADFSKMLEVFGTLKARVQGSEADSEIVRRTQVLTNPWGGGGRNKSLFIMCSVIYFALSVNTIREAEIKPSLNTGYMASDQKPIYSRNSSGCSGNLRNSMGKGQV